MERVYSKKGHYAEKRAMLHKWGLLLLQIIQIIQIIQTKMLQVDHYES